MSDSLTSNPYAVTTDALALPGMGSDFEAIRKKYISHEASVKSIGTLYMLGAALGGLASIVYLVMAVAMMTQPNQVPAAVGMLTAFAFAVAMTVLYVFMAKGLWDLKPWARIVAAVLSGIGLIGFPIGTLISAYFLYLLLSAKGVMVFSDQYKEVIKATPHIKYKTSALVWILLGLLLLIVVAVIVAAVASGR